MTYGINFLGKNWDANIGALETYTECLRVLKPGGHILAFSAARTYHHLAVTIEQAGFEIRDQLMWIYSSGFPKSQDVGKGIQRSLGVEETKASKGMNGYAEVKNKKGKEKWMNPGNVTVEDYPDKKDDIVCTSPEAQQWAGWGTALKPGHEPIVLARKPLGKGNSVARNCQQYGTGALHIDASRIGIEGTDTRSGGSNGHSRLTFGEGITTNEDSHIGYEANEKGRFPSNVLGDIPDYQKYFYCPKVSRKERHVGFDTSKIPASTGGMCDVDGTGRDFNDRKQDLMQGVTGNHHPTVKPNALMKYLVKLVTPPKGIVLDPFCGSGSTGMAATELGHEFVGCELDPAYVKIATTRIEAWNKQDNNFNNLFEE